VTGSGSGQGLGFNLWVAPSCYAGSLFGDAGGIDRVRVQGNYNGQMIWGEKIDIQTKGHTKTSTGLYTKLGSLPGDGNKYLRETE